MATKAEPVFDRSFRVETTTHQEKRALDEDLGGQMSKQKHVYPCLCSAEGKAFVVKLITEHDLGLEDGDSLKITVVKTGTQTKLSAPQYEKARVKADKDAKDSFQSASESEAGKNGKAKPEAKAKGRAKDLGKNLDAQGRVKPKAGKGLEKDPTAAGRARGESVPEMDAPVAA